MDYKEKNKPRGRYDYSLPRPTLMISGTPKGYCDRAPGLVLKCINEYRCESCYIADQIKINYGDSPPPHPVIDERSVFMDKGKKMYSYFRRVVAVRPEVLERFGYKPLLYFQFFKCVDGPGCIPGNTVWEVDGYFLAEPDKPVTLRRSDILGIPTLALCKRYDKCFFANSVKECGYLQGGGVL